MRLLIHAFVIFRKICLSSGTKEFLQNGTNFTLITSIGDIDLLGEVAGSGDFEAVKKSSVFDTLYGCEVRILTIEGLIKAKRAAGRTKDLIVLPELEALQELLAETAEEENQ